MSQYKLTIWLCDDSGWCWSHEFSGRYREFSPVKSSHLPFSSCRMNLPLFKKLSDYLGENPFHVSSDWRLDRLADDGYFYAIAWHFDSFNSCIYDGVAHWLYSPSTAPSDMRGFDLSQSFCL